MGNNTSDRSCEFTIQYFDLLQDTLKIEFTRNERPIFVPNRVSNNDIKKLKKCLRDLHLSKIKEDAIVDMQSFGTRRPLKIQTTAVGYSDDFDLQVKLGLLLGERLVLWDTVLLSILTKSDDMVDLEKLGEVVNGFLQLRPIVEAGDLVLLPQPKTWLERAAKYYRLMPVEASVSNTFKGYVNPSALLEEGIVLHPYLMHDQMDYQRSMQNLPISNSPYYSLEKANYHYSLLRVLKNRNLAFLGDIDATEFYETINKIDRGAMRQLQRKLAVKLSFPHRGMSPEEKEQWLDEIVAELEAVTPKISHRFTAYRLDSGFTGLSALKATFGIIADAKSAGVFSAIISGLGALGNIGSYLQKVFNTPKDPVLYQIFTQLKRAEEAQSLKEIQDEMSIPGALSKRSPGRRLS